MLRKKWVILTGSILVLVIVLGFIAQRVVNDKLDNLLQNTLEKQLGPEYSIDYKSAHFSIIQNKLKVKELEFSKRNQREFQWVVTANKIRFKGFRAIDFLLGKGFGLDELVLENPIIDMQKISDSQQVKSDTGKKNSKIPDVRIQIGAIKCIDGRFSYDPDGPEKFTSNFSFTLRKIDFEGKLQKMNELWDDSGVELSACMYQFPDSVYTVKVDSIHLPKEKDQVRIRNVQFRSNLSKKAFPEKFGWRKSRFDITVPRISVTRPANFADSLLVISEMELDSMRFEIHKDNRYPWPERVTKLPQEGLSEMSRRFKVDSVKFTNSSFTFISVFEDDKPSKLFFTDISGSLANFQNMDTTDTAFVFRANSRFMNQTGLQMKTTYMYGKDAPFECSAVMGETKLSFMSDFLQSAAGIKIEEGSAEKLELQMKGNKYGEYGYVDFYYKDLKLQAVDKETGEKKWLLNVAADIARGLIFWKKNPDNRNFRRGKFQEDRTVYKGFPSQWIEGLFAGILDSVSKIDPTKVRENNNND